MCTRAETAFVARWDLDKTYLRTEFDSFGALARTAIERPDQKRTVPGAAALMRQFAEAGIAIHILSGSPEQLRRRVVEKLRLDGVSFATLTLKPNLQNLLRLRFRALRSQVGYKLPALLRRRCEMPTQRDRTGSLIREVLLGDDAETDALVYSLYADVCEGRIDDDQLQAIMRAGKAYDDDIRDTLRFASYVEPGPVVERILIHLDRQSSPSEFEPFGGRVVPFYNYLQAAYVLFDDGRLPARGVLGVAQELSSKHHFDASSLARSYSDLARRGHVSGRRLDELSDAFRELIRTRSPQSASELGEMVRLLQDLPPVTAPAPLLAPQLDYAGMLGRYRRRR